MAACSRLVCWSTRHGLLLFAASLPLLAGMARPTSSTVGLAPSWRADRPRARLLDVPKRARKKLTFATQDGAHTIDVVKRENESMQHVLMKALLWAMHADEYPAVQIEAAIGDRYTPDCISLDAASGEPLFWGECGRVEHGKVASIVGRFQRMHLVIAKWDINPVGYAAQISRLVAEGRPELVESGGGPTSVEMAAGARLADPAGIVEVVSVPSDSEERFFAPLSGAEPSTYVVTPDRSQLRWVRVWPATTLAAPFAAVLTS